MQNKVNGILRNEVSFAKIILQPNTRGGGYFVFFFFFEMERLSRKRKTLRRRVTYALVTGGGGTLEKGVKKTGGRRVVLNSLSRPLNS